jgi:hypothetical protein
VGADEGFFGERVASVYDERSANMFDPAVVGPAVDLLAELAGDGGVEATPTEMRYAWPAELDLMARLAGMRLEDRWAGWGREPFTALSPSHVSVYEKS